VSNTYDEARDELAKMLGHPVPKTIEEIAALMPRVSYKVSLSMTTGKWTAGVQRGWSDRWATGPHTTEIEARTRLLLSALTAARKEKA